MFIHLGQGQTMLNMQDGGPLGPSIQTITKHETTDGDVRGTTGQTHAMQSSKWCHLWIADYLSASQPHS